MSEMIFYDFTLDNILSVEAPRDTDPDTLHEAVRDKLITLIQASMNASCLKALVMNGSC